MYDKFKNVSKMRKILFCHFNLVCPADLERIETTFRDLTNGTSELGYIAFKRDVFANFLPEKLADVGYFLRI